MPPARVVILGASGFVGSDLLGHLTALGVSTLGLSSADLDLCKPGAAERLQGILCEGDALVVVSAITPDRGKDVRTLMDNLRMAEQVGAGLARSACGHVVYVSSDAVYDDGANPVREMSGCDPKSLHGVMHLARERILAHALAGSAAPFLVLRPTLLYGPRDTHAGYGPNRFVRTARREGKITLFGNGEEKRDHVYIQDLSRLTALCLALRSEGCLNVATGRSVSFFDLAQLIRTFFRGEVRIENTARAMPITHRHFDSTATWRAFPTFRYTPLEGGIKETLQELAQEGCAAERGYGGRKGAAASR